MASALETRILATAGIVGHWNLTEAAGATSAADSTTSALPMTYNAGKPVGVENVKGGGPGLLATSAWASQPVAAGSTLDPRVGTLAVMVTMPATIPTTPAVLGGRGNWMQLRLNAGGSFALYAWIGGTVYTIAMPQNWTVAGTDYYLVGTYDGRYLRLFVNGRMVGPELNIVGQLDSVAGTLYASNNASQLASTVSYESIGSRALTIGEVYDWFVIGTKLTPVTVGLSIDNLYDVDSSLVASATRGSRCAGCHGLRSTLEPTVLRAGIRWHTGCYAVELFQKPSAPPTASTPWPDYEGPIIRIIRHAMRSLTEPVTGLNKPITFDGTRFVFATNSGYDVWGPWAMTAALIAGRYKLSRRHWMVQMAMVIIEKMWGYQTAAGDIVDPLVSGAGNDFVVSHLGESLLGLNHVLTADERARWTANFIKAGEFDFTPGSGRPEAEFYINGNRKAGALLGYWMVYEITGNPVWLSRYNQQYEFMMNPPANAGAYNPYGWRVEKAWNPSDPTVGQGFLIERDPGKPSPPYRTITRADGTIIDGWDPNYNLLGLAFLSRLWARNRDPRILQMMHMMFNMSRARANETATAKTILGQVIQPFNHNGYGGFRQNNPSTWAMACIPAFAFLTGRPDVTGATAAGAFNEVVRSIGSDQIAASAMNRDLAVTIGAWYQTLMPPSPLAYS